MRESYGTFKFRAHGNMVSVYVPQGIEYQKFEVFIYTMNGKKIKTGFVEYHGNGKIVIPVNKIAHGKYFIQIKSGDITAASSVFVFSGL